MGIGKQIFSLLKQLLSSKGGGGATAGGPGGKYAANNDQSSAAIQDLQAQLAAKDALIQSLQQNSGGGGGASNVLGVLFFPDTAGMPCRAYASGGRCNRGNSCTYAHTETSLIKLLKFLSQARSSLDICVFTITCNEIADGIMAAFKRGVQVRIITDNDQALATGSDIDSLRQAGIPLKIDADTYHMHHKYCVIDNNVLITGSFNWTRSAVLNNQENLLILQDAAVCAQYKANFEKLWAKY